jgi:hypothetical protein
MGWASVMVPVVTTSPDSTFQNGLCAGIASIQVFNAESGPSSTTAPTPLPWHPPSR